MADLASLGDLRGKRVLVRSDLNVPLDGTTITDDGRIRASVPTISEPRRGGRTRHRVRPPRPAEGRSRGALLAGPGRRAARPSCSAARSPSPPTRWARVPRRPSPAMSDGDVVLLENLRFNPGETAKTDDERAEFADALAGLADAYVSDGFGVVHRKQASVYDVADPAAVRDGWAGRHRGRGAQAPDRRPRAAVRRRARRRQGRRQARGHRQPDDRPPTACSSAAACSSPSSRPRATRSAPACSTPTASTPARTTCSARRRPASRSCCRSTSSAAASSPPTPRPSRSRPTPSPPT